jgi:hypothetical protein
LSWACRGAEDPNSQHVTTIATCNIQLPIDLVDILMDSPILSCGSLLPHCGSFFLCSLANNFGAHSD